jgi:Flp pilus assembly protein TadG
VRAMNLLRRVGRNESRGQSMVEFALTAPILMFLLVGTAQVGVLYFTQIGVETAAREGARVAAENPGNTGIFPAPASLPTSHSCSGPGDTILACEAVYNSTNQALGGLIKTSTLVVTLTGSTYPTSSAEAPQCAGPSGISDGVVAVFASYRAPVFIPLLNDIFSDPGQNYRTVSSTVKIRVEPCASTNGQ